MIPNSHFPISASHIYPMVQFWGPPPPPQSPPLIPSDVGQETAGALGGRKACTPKPPPLPQHPASLPQLGVPSWILPKCHTPSLRPYAVIFPPPCPRNQSPLGSEGPSIDPECPAVPDKHGFEGLDRAQCRCSWVSGSGRGSFFLRCSSP